MATRLRKKHQEDVRAKIQAGNLINRLQKHVDGKIDLSPAQVTSAKILLDKSVPSLTSIEHSGNVTLTHEQQLEQLK